MAKGIRIDLTDEQIEKLRPIFKLVTDAAKENRHGIAVAQIFRDHLACGYWSHEYAKKVFEVTGQKLNIVSSIDDRED